ncbi:MULTISPECIES: hypothetical protein [Dyella]|uniref:Uncharacterized protein n=2 Tax=Dyella TaxID=231454 RepID=A0A4R0Z4L3_9GAMM|nr:MULTISPECIES: hypothetical protein [Dyella]TBR39092.1 hypothetical protein EYV96_02285 [Dyella terrae]TCI13320.1 hypothetical protein EZM97_08580 [Dyella soli]
MRTLIPFQRETNALQLIPPSLPRAEDNGGIGWDDIRDPAKRIIVLVGPWQHMVEGDVVSVYWQHAGRPVTTYALGADDKGVLALGLPVHDLDIGTNSLIKVWYSVRQRLTGEVSQSPPVHVHVDITVPGGPDPDATTDAINENLASMRGVPPYVPAGQPVTLTIPAWINMEPGDLLTVAWGSYRHRCPPIKDGEPGRPVTVHLTADDIAQGGDGRLAVTYEVRDRVNNWSLWAPPHYVEVELGNRLPRPLVIDADEYDTVHLDRLNGQAVQARVEYTLSAADLRESSVRIERDDLVTFYWEGYTGEGAPLPVHRDARKVEGQVGFLRFDVPFDVVAAAAQGTAMAYYHVLPGKAGGERRSSRRTVRIVGQSVRLVAPDILEAKSGMLDPVDVPNGATVRVPPYRFMQAGDTLALTFDGTDVNGDPVVDYQSRQVSAAMVGKPVDFVVEGAKIARLNRGSAKVYYNVTAFERDARGRLTPRLVAGLRSDTLHVQIRNASQRLAMPTVEEARGGWLDPDLVPDPTGATVAIQRAGVIKGRDHVHLTWSGSRAGEYKDTLPVRDVPGAPMVRFQVPKQHVTGNLGGTVNVSYSVSHPSGPDSHSETLHLGIGKGIGALPGPRVPLAKDGFLDLRDLPAQGLDVHVDAYDGIRVDDVIELRWITAGGEYLVAHRVDQPVPQNIRIPADRVTPARGSTASVHYGIRGHDRQSPTLSFFIAEGGSELIESYHDMPHGPVQFARRPHVDLSSPGDWWVSTESISQPRHLIFPSKHSVLAVTFRVPFREVIFPLWSGPDAFPTPQPFEAVVRTYDVHDVLIEEKRVSGVGRSAEHWVTLAPVKPGVRMARMEVQRVLDNGNGINMGAMRLRS